MQVPKAELLERISECKKLNVEYQSMFHKTRDKLKAMGSEKNWDFRLVGDL